MMRTHSTKKGQLRSNVYIEDFQRSFSEKTSNPDSFASLHEIEQMWGELRANTDKIYSDMIQDMLSNIDESELVRKKKRI